MSVRTIMYPKQPTRGISCLSLVLHSIRIGGFNAQKGTFLETKAWLYLPGERRHQVTHGRLGPSTDTQQGHVARVSAKLGDVTEILKY